MSEGRGCALARTRRSSARAGRLTMHDETFHLEIRKFLKDFGVTRDGRGSR